MQTCARSIVETVRHPLLVLDAAHRVVVANASFYRTFDTTSSATVSHDLFEIDGGQWDIPSLPKQLEGIMSDGAFEDLEVKHNFPLMGARVMLLNARRV